MQEFEQFIKEKNPDLYSKRNIFIKVKTAFALAYYHSQKDIPKSQCVVSDNAPEYNKIAMSDHALCWVHDARRYKKLSPINEIFKKKRDDFMDKYWIYYHKLLDYKDKPTKKEATYLSKEFDNVFASNTNYFQLNELISKTASKKQELLTALKYPEIPLHNNLAELGARRQVRKRDISLHTMTKKGTINQDAFLTIGQTAIQLGVNIFKYIKELIADNKERQTLADIIYKKIELES